MLTLKYVIGQDQRALTPFELHEGDTFDLSKDPNVAKNKVQAMQYDSGMDQIFLELFEDEKDSSGNRIPFDLSGANIMFEGWKPDGKYVVDADIMTPVSLQQGQCRIDLPAQAFAVYGSYKQAFFRIYRDNKNIATLEFTFNVRADMVQGQIKSVEWIGPVHEILEQAKADYENHKKTLDEAVSGAITEYNKEMATLKSLGADVDSSLQGLLQKIKQDGLFTQAEADAFKQAIQRQLDKLRQNTVNTYDTENDFMQSSLDSGMKARTLGCTSLNDGLGALYKIVDEQPDNGYSLKLANGKYAMLIAVDAFRKAHMAYQAGQVGELSDQRTLGTTNLVTNSGITVSRTTKGSGQDATVVSITANSQDPTSAVGGINTQKLLSYGNLDSVALYVANATDNPHITIEKGTYSTTKNTFVLNEDINGINPGMYIALTDAAVTHSKLKVSDIVYLAQILKVDGRTLTVDGYYSKDQADPLDAGPSPSTYTAYINPITKRWAINPVIEIGADDRPSGSAVEGNVKNHNTSDTPDDLGVFDAVNLKEGQATFAFRAHTNSADAPFATGVDLTNAIQLVKGYGTPQSFQKIITAERTDKDIPFIMDYDGAVSYEALIPTKEQQANWASFQVQDAGASYTLKNVHNGQYLTLAIGTAGDFSLLVDEQNVQSIDYNDANTPRHGLKMTFQRVNGGYMLFRIFVYQNRAYIVSMVNGKFISAEGS